MTAAGSDNLILVGFMGVGKSSVGRRLSHLLGRPFVDADEWIEELAGRDIPSIFSEEGEAAFRDYETKVARRIASRRGLVVATGGGMLGRAENVRLLRSTGTLICLTADPERILERTRPWSSRPLLAGAENPLQTVRALLAQRASQYNQAELSVDTTDRTIEEVAEELCAVFSCR